MIKLCSERQTSTQTTDAKNVEVKVLNVCLKVTKNKTVCKR